MRFLQSTGGVKEDEFAGVLTTYKHLGVPTPIRHGAPWAADNCAFAGDFDPDRFYRWLWDAMLPFRDTCMFVTVPDVVGDAGATLEMFEQWRVRLDGWPLALVLQDGMERMEWPALCDFTDHFGDVAQDDSDEEWYRSLESWRSNMLPFSCVFLGGSSIWKESEEAASLLVEADRMGKHCHIGRVNWGRRYRHFRLLPGSDKWTCDGNRQRAEGRSRAFRAWVGYQHQAPLFQCIEGNG